MHDEPTLTAAEAYFEFQALVDSERVGGIDRRVVRLRLTDVCEAWVSAAAAAEQLAVGRLRDTVAQQDDRGRFADQRRSGEGRASNGQGQAGIRHAVRQARKQQGRSQVIAARAGRHRARTRYRSISLFVLRGAHEQLRFAAFRSAHALSSHRDK